ncbi:unnamed protein product [Periconia digitata]|uniref:Uncharacterized protein n=1 Tax=Periconia digitata TaxID=1303443 RepID=A0A9W4XYJ9_9PLEO|nr:unnamed protein product [Periconia digitata]
MPTVDTKTARILRLDMESEDGTAGALSIIVNMPAVALPSPPWHTSVLRYNN